MTRAARLDWHNFDNGDITDFVGSGQAEKQHKIEAHVISSIRSPRGDTKSISRRVKLNDASTPLRGIAQGHPHAGEQSNDESTCPRSSLDHVRVMRPVIHSHDLDYHHHHLFHLHDDNNNEPPNMLHLVYFVSRSGCTL